MELIHDTVKALTREEKRIVSMFLQGQDFRDQKEVFSVLIRHKLYRKKIFCQKTGLSEKDFKKILSKLDSNILKSLKVFKNSKITPNDLPDLVSGISWFYKKSLYERALKLIKKGKEIALIEEEDSIVDQLTLLEVRILFSKMGLNRLEDSIEHIQVSQAAALGSKTSNKIQYWLILLQTLSIARQSGLAQTNDARIEQLVPVTNSPLLIDVKTALSHEARVLYFYICMLIAQISGQTSRAIKMGESMIEAIESKRNFLQKDSTLYVSGLNALTIIYLKQLDKPKAELNLDKLKNAPKTNVNSEFNILIRYWQNKLILLSVERDFKTSLKGLEQIKVLQDKFELWNLPEVFAFLASDCTMHCGQYSKTLHYISILRNIRITNALRPDLIAAAQILYLLCQYGMGELKYVSSIVPKTRTYLKRYAFFNDEIDKTILTFLKKADKYNTNEKKKKAEQKLISLIKTHKKAIGNTGFLNYFDLDYWLIHNLTHQNEELLPQNLAVIQMSQ